MSDVKVSRQFQGESDVRTFHDLEEVSRLYLVINGTEKPTMRFHDLISISQSSHTPYPILWKYFCCQCSKLAWSKLTLNLNIFGGEDSMACNFFLKVQLCKLGPAQAFEVKLKIQKDKIF